MSNYALDTPIKRNIYVPDTDIPFAPAFSPPNPPETDQTHRYMTWRLDNREKVFDVNISFPKSARLDKKK